MSATHAKVFATHCKNNHPWSEENTRLLYLHGKVRQRRCLICLRGYAASRTAELSASNGPKLDMKQLGRLLDAHRDGVLKADLQERFGLNDQQLVDRLAEALALEQQRESA